MSGKRTFQVCWLQTLGGGGEVLLSGLDADQATAALIEHQRLAAAGELGHGVVVYLREEERPDGVALIAGERRRQVEVEGWSAEHDDQWVQFELVMAAVCYLWIVAASHLARVARPPLWWPWDWSWWKPDHEDPMRNLVKAGALVAAEIDRLLRLLARQADAAGGQTVRGPEGSETG